MTRRRMELAVGRALKATPLQPSDGAAAELARSFARVIDADDAMIPQVGRQFLETLAQLGMTPKARAALAPTEVPTQQSGLDEIRARRELRA
jgi:hypothetical protein